MDTRLKFRHSNITKGVQQYSISDYQGLGLGRREALRIAGGAQVF